MRLPGSGRDGDRVGMPPALKAMLTLIALFIGLFIVLCLYMFLRQDRLLFYPVRHDPLLLQQWESQRVEIAMGDHRVEGWWIENANANTQQVVLYFGGNAEDVLYTASTSRALDAARVLVTNYRGYGASSGRPSQAALFEDALAVYDYVVQHAAVAPNHIVVMGRSLGSGVATYLAAHRPVRGVILITPFDSIAAVAQKLYPFLPIRLLLRHPFPSDTFAPRITAPALILAAEHDALIPPAHAERLFDRWGARNHCTYSQA